MNKGALEDAGILPVERPPLTIGQKITRGLIAVSVLALVGVSYWLIAGRFALSREQRLFKAGTEYVKAPDAQAQIGREGMAALHGLAGEFFLLSHQPDSAAKAKAELDAAVTALRDPKGQNLWGPNERDLVLGDIALLQVDLSGSQAEIDKGERATLDEAQKGYKTSLDLIQLPEARREAFRAVAQKLQERGQAARALGLAPQVFPPDEKDDGAAIAGIVTGSQKVDWKDSKSDLKPEIRMIALVTALENAKGEATEIEPALKWATETLKTNPEIAWSVPRLVEIAARSGQSDEASKALIDDIKDLMLKNRARLAIVKTKLAREKKVVDDAILEGIDPRSLEHRLGEAAIARHNVRTDESSIKQVEALTDAAKAFASLGAALGLKKE